MKKFIIAILFATTSVLMAGGATIYTKGCLSCHGSNGKKHPLDKPATIHGQSVATIVKKLKGYKSGTLNMYGMGGLMRGQVKSLSNKDIKSVAKYISKLK